MTSGLSIRLHRGIRDLGRNMLHRQSPFRVNILLLLTPVPHCCEYNLSNGANLEQISYYFCCGTGLKNNHLTSFTCPTIIHYQSIDITLYSLSATGKKPINGCYTKRYRALSEY